MDLKLSMRSEEIWAITGGMTEKALERRKRIRSEGSLDNENGRVVRALWARLSCSSRADAVGLAVMRASKQAGMVLSLQEERSSLMSVLVGFVKKSVRMAIGSQS